MNMKRMDFTSLFYNQVRDHASLVRGLESLLGSETHTVTAIPYVSDRAPLDCFRSQDGKRAVDVLSTYDGLLLCELVFRPPGDNEGLVKGRFFVTKQPDLADAYVVLTIESIDFVSRALLPFVEHNKHDFYLTFLRHEDLHSLLGNFRSEYGFTDLRVVRASLISRFPSGTGEAIIPSVSWPRLGLDGAFKYANEQNAWFKSLKFEALKESRVTAEVGIYRNGVIKTDGDFRSIYASLVSQICALAQNNVELFGHRSRRENPDFSVRPLAIHFDVEQFEDVEENAKFIGAMRKLDNASVSVVHGNPYISLAVMDYSDGSAFDIWVLNPSEILIVPQFKSTVPAIKRVISCVFENYAEGTIRDYPTVG